MRHDAKLAHQRFFRGQARMRRVAAGENFAAQPVTNLAMQRLAGVKQGVIEGVQG